MVCDSNLTHWGQTKCVLGSLVYFISNWPKQNKSWNSLSLVGLHFIHCIGFVPQSNYSLMIREEFVTKTRTRSRPAVVAVWQVKAFYAAFKIYTVTTTRGAYRKNLLWIEIRLNPGMRLLEIYANSGSSHGKPLVAHTAKPQRIRPQLLSGLQSVSASEH